jgi:hypothetical protein
MRRIIAAATFALVLGVAGATDPTEPATEGKAYVGFSFGGQKVAPRDFHYGLRVDPDSRFAEGLHQAPLMQIDFTRRGLNDARVNGLSVLKQQYRLRQAEEEAAAEGGEAAAAEEPGFFSRTWSGVKNFFGGLFGGGDEEEAAEEQPAETAEAGAEAAPEEIAEGMFMGFNAVDWVLLAVGAAGVGAVASEVSGGDEDPDPTGGGGGGGGGGGTQCVPGPIPNLCAPLRSETRGTGNDERVDPAYAEWLDGGTGQMGDLGGS